MRYNLHLLLVIDQHHLVSVIIIITLGGGTKVKITWLLVWKRRQHHDHIIIHRAVIDPKSELGAPRDDTLSMLVVSQKVGPTLR